MPLSNLSDHWSLAYRAFQTGARAHAKNHLHSALHSPPSSPLHRTILQINHHALDPSPSPLHPTTPSSSPLPIRLLTHEAALISAYNSSLSHFRSQNLHYAASILDPPLSTLPALLATAYSTQQPPSDNAWLQCASLADSVRLNPSLFLQLPSNSIHSVLRLLHAAAAAFELRSAIALTNSKLSTSQNAASTAKALRALAQVELTRPQNTQQNNTPITTSQDHPLQSDLNAQNETLDNHVARPALLLALTAAQSNNHTEALEAILPRAREAATTSASEAHLPSAYLAAALLIRHGGDTDLELATQLLQTCVSRGYRSADSLALLARLVQGQEAIAAWQRVVAIDFRRPVALWLAAMDMAKEGMYMQQAELLQCLQQVMREVQQVENRKVVSMGEKERVDEKRVVLGRGSALCGMGAWEEAEQVLEGCGTEGAVLKAWAKLGSGSVDESLQESEEIEVGNDEEWVSRIMGGLARAEGMMRMERVKEAHDEIMREARYVEEGVLRGVCFHNLGVVRWCLEGNADECFAAAQSAFAKAGEKKLQVESTFARVVCMWGAGRRSDAATHWVAKRGLGVGVPSSGEIPSAGRVDKTLVTQTEEQSLKRLDAVCARVCRAEEARRRLNETIEDIQRQWSSG